MTKKKYTFTLDEEPVEELRVLLKAKGVSLSGFIASVLREQADVMKMVEKTGGGDMPVSDFFALFSRMMKGLKA
jgi:hypothetical protein